MEVFFLVVGGSVVPCVWIVAPAGRAIDARFGAVSAFPARMIPEYAGLALGALA